MKNRFWDTRAFFQKFRKLEEIFFDVEATKNVLYFLIFNDFEHPKRKIFFSVNELKYDSL